MNFKKQQKTMQLRALQAAKQQALQQKEQGSFREFNATELYCPKCKQAMPIRERLLLVLPGGDLYDYVCTQCGTSLGTKQG